MTSPPFLCLFFVYKQTVRGLSFVDRLMRKGPQRQPLPLLCSEAFPAICEISHYENGIGMFLRRLAPVFTPQMQRS